MPTSPPTRASWRPSRRALLRTGVLGALGLWGASTLARGLPPALAAKPALAAEAADATAANGSAPLVFFQPGHVPIARAVIGALNDGSLPVDPAARREAIARGVLAADAYFSSYTPAVQDEARQALDLLGLAPVRWWGGLWAGWADAAPADVNAYLEGWRTGRLRISRQVYHLLAGIGSVGWYSQPAAWAGIGYPGPPDLPRPSGEAPA